MTRVRWLVSQLDGTIKNIAVVITKPELEGFKIGDSIDAAEQFLIGLQLQTKDNPNLSHVFDKGEAPGYSYDCKS